MHNNSFVATVHTTRTLETRMWNVFENHTNSKQVKYSNLKLFKMNTNSIFLNYDITMRFTQNSQSPDVCWTREYGLTVEIYKNPNYFTLCHFSGVKCCSRKNSRTISLPSSMTFSIDSRIDLNKNVEKNYALLLFWF